MPPPVTPLDLVERAVAPRSPADRERFARALAELAAADPSLIVRADRESDEAVLAGADEVVLQRAVDALGRGLPLVAGRPRVAYRETLGRRVEVDHAYEGQTGASGAVARVKIAFEPTGRGSGYWFEDRIVGAGLPRPFVAGVERGLALARAQGLLAGFPVIDFKAALLDGAARQDDSSAEAFALAAAGAFQALRDRGEPILLEPVMSLEVAAHGADMSAIASDLERRGARVMAEFVEGEERTLTAAAPLANLFGYAARLDAISSGRASLAMRFRGYQPVSMTAPVPASALAESPYAQMADQDFSWPNLIPPRDLPAPADPANDR